MKLFRWNFWLELDCSGSFYFTLGILNSARFQMFLNAQRTNRDVVHEKNGVFRFTPIWHIDGILTLSHASLNLHFSECQWTPVLLLQFDVACSLYQLYKDKVKCDLGHNLCGETFLLMVWKPSCVFKCALLVCGRSYDDSISFYFYALRDNQILCAHILVRKFILLYIEGFYNNFTHLLSKWNYIVRVSSLCLILSENKVVVIIIIHLWFYTKLAREKHQHTLWSVLDKSSLTSAAGGSNWLPLEFETSAQLI